MGLPHSAKKVSLNFFKMEFYEARRNYIWGVYFWRPQPSNMFVTLMKRIIPFGAIKIHIRICRNSSYDAEHLATAIMSHKEPMYDFLALSPHKIWLEWADRKFHHT